jgi:outer membrane receptor protein involved in Fe transport
VANLPVAPFVLALNIPQTTTINSFMPVKVRGAMLGYERSLTDDWELELGFFAQKVDGGLTAQEQNMVPHRGGFLALRRPERGRVPGVTLAFQGYGDYEGSVALSRAQQIPGWGVVDLHLKKTVVRNLEAVLSIRNLGDKGHLEGIIPGPSPNAIGVPYGREAWLSLVKRF